MFAHYINQGFATCGYGATFGLSAVVFVVLTTTNIKKINKRITMIGKQ